MLSILKNNGVWFRSIFPLLLLAACRPNAGKTVLSNEIPFVDSLIKANPTIDSLAVWLDYFTRIGDNRGEIRVRKALGKRYREATRFKEAIDCHRQGLELATRIGDTLEMIQALNNIGTNFRRMGILDEASTYHFKALSLCGQYKGQKGHTARKNRVVSLNGIGNIHLTLGNYDVADSVFRQALAGERELGSPLGQAINYANLGSIFEARGMTDSALTYYWHSMDYNRKAKSRLGISLCHTHFGRLAEKEGRWDEAIREYRNAYDLMEGRSDRWHWLESCLALARVNISKGDIPAAVTYLRQAGETADDMHSWEHLSEVCRLAYFCYDRRGDCRKALDFYIRSRAYADSVKSNENVNHLQNLRVNYEKEKNIREMTLIRQNYEMEQRTQYIFLVASLLALILTLAVIMFLWYAVRMKSRNQQMLKSMEKVRNNFFMNVTHEFRTPLTVILGTSEQLRKGSMDEEDLRTGLLTIDRQSKNLLGLVNQLLEISKVKSEVGEPEWRNGDIVSYVRMITENHQTYARHKQVGLHFITTETVITMDFVPEYFRKIICNLLSNAIKFTPKGGRITLTMSREKNSLVIQVGDTGCGISAENLPHIFETFYQGDNGCTEPGSGIGLSLVQQMVGCMSGRINVESRIGKGSVFTIILPLCHGNSKWKKWLPEEKPAEDEILPETVNKNGKPEAALKEIKGQSSLLIVEDNADLSFYLGNLLKKDYRLFYARNGIEGLEMAAEHLPDLILTDLMMPEMDGYELCRKVRYSNILNHIPIIIITAKSEENDRVEGLDAGADAYLLKPFNTAELTTRIAKLLEQRRLLREKYSRALHEGNEQSVELNPADREFLNRLNDLIYSLISNYNLNSDMLADKICMSKSQLNRKVRMITGYNTTAYILQLRLERSKRMLTSTETLIRDIAMQCGFEDTNYFSRLFKQVFNLTPSQWRKNLK